MEKQTIIFTALPNGRAADGALKLSVFISLRLWNDDPSIKKMKLSQFPDFLPWTDLVAAANWQVAFEGGPTLNASVEPNPLPLRKDLWNALFKADTDVLPFQFNDYRGADIETSPSAQINDYLTGVYVRAATELPWGAGKDLPKLETVAVDRDIRDIALPSHPRRPSSPSDRPPPKDLGGRGPRPNPEPKPEPEPEPIEPTDRGCCLCGCLAIPFVLLARIFPPLKPFFDRLCGSKASPEPDLETEDKPNFPVEPIPKLPPAAPPIPAPPTPSRGPFFEPPPGPPSVNRAAFDKLTKFVKPFSVDSHALPTAAELEEIYDFHQMISSLGDYPELMRRVGLVVDLLVPLDGAVPPPQATVKLVPTGFDPVISTPRTHYTLTATGFATRPRPVDPEISNGFLRFNDPNLFRVTQVDTVGSGIKMRTMATNICGFEKKEDRAPNMPDTAGLPALRSAGIAVVRLNLETELRDRFLRSHALQQSVFAIDNAPQLAPPPDAGPPAPPTDELFAEDVVRGYRIDVFDSKSTTWHSLCQRVGTYNFLDAPDVPGGKILETIEDEGFVQLGVTEPMDQPAKAKLRATDSIFVWDGWSLCAPRPGLSIMQPGDDPDDVTLEKPKNEAKTKFKLETEFEAAKHTLPRFRFDYQYRLRARACDLAGNSIVGPTDLVEFAKDVAEQTLDFPCARFEPVSPPAMLLRAKPVEGESLERLVVRTGTGIAASSQTTERHVIPPKTSQLMAEQHGKFDLVPNMDSSGFAYDRAVREGGALTDGVLPDKAVQVPGTAKSDPWVYAGTQFKIAYLPDPSSKGVLLLGLPGLNPEEIVEPTALKRVNKIPFDDPWPDPLPFRIRLVAIPDGAVPGVPAEPKWEDGPGEAQRVLTFELAAAEQKVVRLSSYLEPDDLDKQGVNQWVKEKAPASAPQVELDTVSGRSWLHLPWRDITLVHAVVKPLGPPTADVKSPSTDRKPGETFATLSGTVTSHAASTGKVDLRAKWVDDIDDPAQAEPGLSPQETYICQLQVEETKDITTILDSATKEKIKHQFGDTKYHSATYMPNATTRFREYFPEIITKNAANISVDGPDSAPVDIFSSRRPDAPKVLYVIPTFGWADDAAPPPDTVSRTRKGGGLRVYLDRPWYSSGSGELLGVVFMEGQKFLDLEENQIPYVTQWGVDPIWFSPATDEFASQTNFKGFSNKKAGVELEETGEMVSVVGYVPEFDKARKLWFADIEMTTGSSYMPFVRLALARYQPNSIKKAEISRVVRAEFAQYANDRVASVTTNPTATGAKIHILVTGTTYEASSVTIADRDFWGKDGTRRGLAEIEATLQKRNPNLGSDPHLGWETIAPPTLLGDDNNNPRTWEGDVELTQSLASGTFRILLQEYEWYRSDFEGEENVQKATVARRVVYADAFLIS